MAPSIHTDIITSVESAVKLASGHVRDGNGFLMYQPSSEVSFEGSKDWLPLEEARTSAKSGTVRFKLNCCAWPDPDDAEETATDASKQTARVAKEVGNDAHTRFPGMFYQSWHEKSPMDVKALRDRQSNAILEMLGPCLRDTEGCGDITVFVTSADVDFVQVFRGLKIEPA
ncbi:hypothetical protein Q5752_006047 [Cryptotrichosporon argae]